MKEVSKSARGKSWAVRCDAFVFFICPLEADAGQDIQVPRLLPEKTAIQQRLEGIEIFGLEGVVELITEVVSSRTDPWPESINPHYPYPTTLKPFRSNALLENSGFGIGHYHCVPLRLRLSLTALGLDSPVPLNLAPLGEVMDNKPPKHIDRQAANDADCGPIQFGKFKWYHWCLFFLACFFHGAGMRGIWSYFQTNVKVMTAPLAGATVETEVKP